MVAIPLLLAYAFGVAGLAFYGLLPVPSLICLAIGVGFALLTLRNLARRGR